MLLKALYKCLKIVDTCCYSLQESLSFILITRTFEVLTITIYVLYRTIVQVELCGSKTWSYVHDAKIICRCLKHNAKENV